MVNASTLKKKTMVGLFWSFVDLMAKGGMQVILQIILARLLLPEHFGLIGMIIVFIAISETVIDSGFSQALIRDKYTTQVDYSTVFYFNIAVSLFIYFILFILSKPISMFFGEPQLTGIIKVLSLVIIISSLGIIQRVMLAKKVDFKTLTKVNIIAVIISGSITIAMAILGYGVWSLVINMISMQFVQTLLLFIYNKWIPSFTFNIQSFKKYFGFGYKLLLSSLLDTFYNNILYVIIGRTYSTTQLGYFTNANKFRDLAAYSITSTVQRVSYPVLSSIQEDEKRLKTGFRKIIITSAFISFPLMIGLASIATPLFSVFLGNKWIPSVLYFQLLCFAGMLYPIHVTNLNILQVKGRSDLFLLIEIIKKSVLTILIILSLVFKMGIIGLIGAMVINSYISLYINTYYSAKEIDYSASEQLRDLFPVFFVSIFMGATVFLVGSLFPNENFMKLILQIVLGVTVYVVGCKLARIEEMKTAMHMITAILLKVKIFMNKNKSDKELIEKSVGDNEY